MSRFCASMVSRVQITNCEVSYVYFVSQAWGQALGDGRLDRRVWGELGQLPRGCDLGVEFVWFVCLRFKVLKCAIKVTICKIICFFEGGDIQNTMAFFNEGTIFTMTSFFYDVDFFSTQFSNGPYINVYLMNCVCCRSWNTGYLLLVEHTKRVIRCGHQSMCQMDGPITRSGLEASRLSGGMSKRCWRSFPRAWTSWCLTRGRPRCKY